MESKFPPNAEKIHPELVVIDFDRTLGNVDASMERLYLASAAVGLDANVIKEARLSTENDGGSFDPYTFVQQTLSPEALETFNTHFITADGPSILYDDAEPFLKQLDLNAVPYHVLTYGVNPEWQRLKVAASGYKGSMTVMDHIDKGAYINEWKHENELFSPDEDGITLSAKTVSLIDDKAKAFTSLPGDCHGFLLQRAGEILPSQQGNIAPHVAVITSLEELIIKNGSLLKR